MENKFYSLRWGKSKGYCKQKDVKYSEKQSGIYGSNEGVGTAIQSFR